jgi:hypothetical protein
MSTQQTGASDNQNQRPTHQKSHVNRRSYQSKRTGQRVRRGQVAQVNASEINISEGKPGRYVKSKDQLITTEGRSNNHVRRDGQVNMSEKEVTVNWVSRQTEMKELLDKTPKRSSRFTVLRKERKEVPKSTPNKVQTEL